jgi:hypothetical protein
MAEPKVFETNESGKLQIPAGILGAGPHARFRPEHDGETPRWIREAPRGVWEDRTPDERVRSFHDWVARLPKRKDLPIPAEALRRENLYD